MNDKRWTVGEIARSAAEVLEKKGIEQARLDADLLLAFTLGFERLELYTRFDMPVDDDQRAQYRELIKRRLTREPVAYILRKRDFLDHTFEVGPGVLVPRPETENVVEAASLFLEGEEPKAFIEVGAGSGCIAISLLSRHPNARGLAIDLSEEALGYTQRNAEAIGVADRLSVLQSDVFAALAGHADWRDVDLIVSNPPYIRREERETLSSDVVDFEPEMALFCAEDGLAIHRRILTEKSAFLRDDGGVVMELGAGSGRSIVDFAKQQCPGSKNICLPDYAGHDRVFMHTNHAWPDGFSGLHGATDTSEEMSES